ncbi:hypothetical protein D3P07_21280 [Paenibacillus sp. 1011MAR3C5]|uniref:hypothetical protein n=1 Tax=Paenibacillus sp. 1011MAR3C5 TaxID=1675787 RepID=UPI000E6B9DED|nr:hypothetical protein [Paenibacillus sp. 1011MAR3C5]RJE85106.1 hypothetical protein D3P07_21280 [Paenibacillus sp. 1011MAR3C5]
MNKLANKQRMTKVLLTATMCAIMIFTAAACNSDTNGTSNNNNLNNNAPIVTDDPLATEPIVPGDADDTVTE